MLPKRHLRGPRGWLVCPRHHPRGTQEEVMMAMMKIGSQGDNQEQTSKRKQVVMAMMKIGSQGDNQEQTSKRKRKMGPSKRT